LHYISAELNKYLEEAERYTKKQVTEIT